MGTSPQWENEVRTEQALRVEPILRAKAKERQGTRNDLNNFPPNSAESLPKGKNEVRNQIAKIAGVGHDTIERVEKIKAEADPETIEKVRKGEMSINKAYTQIRNRGETDPVGRWSGRDFASAEFSGSK